MVFLDETKNQRKQDQLNTATPVKSGKTMKIGTKSTGIPPRSLGGNHSNPHGEQSQTMVGNIYKQIYDMGGSNNNHHRSTHGVHDDVLK